MESLVGINCSYQRNEKREKERLGWGVGEEEIRTP
jgi:hypothetical protein